jgi:hypothetical protein
MSNDERMKIFESGIKELRKGAEGFVRYLRSLRFCRGIPFLRCCPPRDGLAVASFAY